MTRFPPWTPERQALVRAQDDRLRERTAFSKDHVCAVCGGILGMRKWWDGEPMLFCMEDHTHQGYALGREKAAHKGYASRRAEVMSERKGIRCL